MEASWRPAGEASSMGPMGGGPTDWRTMLHPEARQRIVNKIIEALTRHLPISVPEGLIELRKVAVRFEDKTYNAASSESDYLRRISLKLLSMETKNYQPAPLGPPISQNFPDWVPINNSAITSWPNESNKRLRTPIINLTTNFGNDVITDSGTRAKRAKASQPGEMIAQDPAINHDVSPETPGEPAFICPICWGTMTSPSSTICGHIFCEGCIKNATKRRKECPTCRRKLSGRNMIHRVFFPTTSLS